MDKPTAIGIIANLSKPDAVERTRELASRFRDSGAKIFLESATAKVAGEAHGKSIRELAAHCQVIVVLGGDGTILHAARQLGENVRPLAAINIGRLGFLTSSTVDEIDFFVRCICCGDYRLSQRSLIGVSFTDKKGMERSLWGLNEITITRGAISRLIRLEVFVNGEQLNRYAGDGLIVATPTGSTAYSLSAGGPLVNPEAGVFIITPICSHALASRAFVVNDDVVLEIRPEEHREEILLTVDGGSPFSLHKDFPVILRRAAHTLPLVMLNGRSFYSVLQQKLRWMGTNV